MIYFLKYTKFYFIFSILIIALGSFAILKYGFNYAIDFTGGSVIEYRFKAKDVSINLIKKTLSDRKIKALSIETLDKNTFLIKTTPIDEKQEATVRKNLEGNKSIGKVQSLRFETVGPSLGKETVRKTIIASIVAIFGILIYITITFRKLNYGIAAIIATFHDFFVLIGVYALLSHFLGAEVDSLFITAVLTTMAFSVHDTIVVFDKIREYRRTSALSIEILANKALTETMVRSVNNSLTIILMLIPLVIFGTLTLKFFAAALLIGTITGTYSSPFIATPLLVGLEKLKSK
ncbi:protein-export membrane protein SecF [Candidatus Roizmanbacteria bacterium RIFCSPHIGHO2_01_FULL_38_41]|uniref:Protein-export membrane protein SecF n=1 Tax=Candidatus Roizmanbacteria bacterium RIFCSPHIGHO2_02_FULL_37_24 TaxID=1802037 RepID=A0A1F7H001_9BACT|nr:MAG: protein-export membrane protein SecF [Candidatus Roizmanbacteria bacterium RIFCSPHIGHO2_01_FULL_38_41]OGK24710.1 MAG: protein-export membrane protein SecF [Candidatus Roizmanbacteria bacterium RIFCSPHIGHO2_02_FULL_37_24]OGK44101.1 MAG: protein-export membrane protein SecF [Candidatus Roizmanbacteria bacterium RIFCSPLOWO2_01_FULL_37_57]OGK59086.1 MAG: protein-export membrane protein SecF [Candidatus Roizmanbacteria bacterium RIFCSPLOWO2_12_FULL_37_7b]